MELNHTLLRAIAGILICTLLCPLAAYPQKSKDQKKQEKEKKENVTDERRLDKTIRKYEETLGKAKEKYAKDEEFRENVDYEFRKLRREHAQAAFEYNTLDSDDWLISHSGDKLPKNTDSMYDNLLAQDYVNRVGQSLVPSNSENRYGFKITVNPMPDARSLSTGTVYISTGLLSLVDNEAQLAYILAHEITHVEKEHWRQDVLVAEWVEDATKSTEKKGKIIGAVTGGITGGLLGGNNVGEMVFLGAWIGKTLTKMLNRKSFEWSLAQEDEADDEALKLMIERNYDVREADTFYETLRAAAIDDPRVELERFGDRKRSEERRKFLNGVIRNADSSRLAKTQLGAVNLRGKSLSLDRNLNVVINRLVKNQEKMSDDIRLRIQNGEIMAGDGEFESIMSAVKRDNGIVAFYYDMFKLSAQNLNQSLAVRSDDALGYFYYGKVLKLTARKPGEKERALQMFTKAIDLDKRNAIPQSRLYVALTKMSGRSTNNIQEIVTDLKQYVGLYQQLNGGALPPSMGSIYDYLQEAGELDWNAVAVTNVKNVGIVVSPTPASTPATKRK